VPSILGVHFHNISLEHEHDCHSATTFPWNISICHGENLLIDRIKT
jgi:hypothetical protein